MFARATHDDFVLRHCLYPATVHQIERTNVLFYTTNPILAKIESNEWTPLIQDRMLGNRGTRLTLENQAGNTSWGAKKRAAQQTFDFWPRS